MSKTPKTQAEALQVKPGPLAESEVRDMPPVGAEPEVPAEAFEAELKQAADAGFKAHVVIPATKGAAPALRIDL